MKPFKFKQFTILQDQCGMKIGTDGVLLGAWAAINHNPYSILDIGAGTGIISLMLAQRSHAENIEAIEIDDSAYEQCTGNFENSPWRDRLFCFHAGFDEFVDESKEDDFEEKYDLIVSNPPYFLAPKPSLPTAPLPERENSDSRKKARFHDSLPFNELVEGVSKILSNDGVFSLIVPFAEEENIITLSASYQLFPKRITRVKGNSTTEIKRSLLEFTFNKTDISINELIIEKERHQYTEAYINLTKDFYLKM